MNQLRKSCSTNLLILVHYLENIWSIHCPREIALYIVYQYYQLFRLKISVGSDHLLLLFDGDIYARGSNYWGQLGFTMKDNCNTLQKLKTKKFKQIVAGSYYSMALTMSGKVYIWGRTNFGGLYDPRTYHPKKVVFPLDGTRIKKIIGGSRHVIAISNQDEIWVWGENYRGQLGFGNNYHYRFPQKLEFLLPHEKIKKIVCGRYHSMVLTTLGEVYSWGKKISNGFDIKVTRPTKLNLKNIEEIICKKSNHSVVIDKSNKIYTWGKNSHGQLGLGHQIDVPHPIELCYGFTTIVCSCKHSMAIMNSDIYVWGRNNYAELGPISSLTIKELKHYQAETIPKTIDFPFDATRIKKIIYDDFFSIAVTYSNELYLSEYLIRREPPIPKLLEF
jgi:alpha-tubulin suppressor-like RCC1 family protein